MDVIQFFIAGNPSPGGSKNAFALRNRSGGVVCRPNGSPIINVTDAGGKKTKEWRRTVSLAARQHYSRTPLIGPVEVSFAFGLARPKGHFGSGRNANVLRASSPSHPTGKPDVLKLARSTEDAMTGIIWRDDAATVMLSATKFYCNFGEQPGVNVTIRSLVCEVLA